MNETQKLLGVREVSDWLGIPVMTIYQYVHAGLLPHIKITRRCLRFKRQDIESFLEERTIDRLVASTKER